MSIDLLYGIPLLEATKNDLKNKKLKLFSMPMYGNSTSISKSILGMKYGSIPGFYDQITTFDSTTVNIHDELVENSVKKRFGSDDSRPKCYALVSGVYTSHYVAGVLMVGFWIDYDRSNFEIEDKLFEATFEDNPSFSIVNPSHVINNRGYFIGKVLGMFGQTEDYRDCEKLAIQLTQKWEIPTLTINDVLDMSEYVVDNFGGTLRGKQSTVFIPTMCHCCT